MNKLIAFLFICLQFTSTTFARKPAIEPIMGSSIEEYKEVDPSKAKGYDFSRKPSGKNAIKKESRVHSSTDLKTDTAVDTTTASTNILFLFFIFLPIIASGIAFFRINRKEDVESVEATTAKTEESKSSKEDIKKAS